MADDFDLPGLEPIADAFEPLREEQKEIKEEEEGKEEADRDS